MPKINKDFSDALGFRLLSNYTSFAEEYPVEGARIQKLYDDNFRETCFKCYPIITEAGVDPREYVAKQKKTSIKDELRSMFPIKVKPGETEKKVLEIVTDDEEDEMTVVVKTSPRKCLNCEKLKHDLKKYEEENAKLKNQFDHVTKQNEQMSRFLSEKNKELRRVSLEFTALKTEYSRIKKELESIKGDSEFMSILEYQRKKRKH